MGSAAFPPHLYPWVAAPVYPWVADPAGYAPLEIRREGRTLMVAVGSNASRAVLTTKLADVGGVDISPARVVVHGIAVGYSAHVSARGYIPAAPFASPGATSTLTAFWLDDEQLAALDRTEPNYHRLTVTTTSHPLRERLDDVDSVPVRSPVPVREFAVYASRHGVLTDRQSTPLPFSTQGAVLAHLAEDLDDPSLAEPPATVCARLGDPDTGKDLTRRIHQRRLFRPDGLTRVPAHHHPDDTAHTEFGTYAEPDDEIR